MEGPPQAGTGSQSATEMSSPSKESAKFRTQRPSSRLQELEHELAKIHQKCPNLAAASSAQNSTSDTAPVTVIYSVPAQNPPYQQQPQTLPPTALPVSSVPVATVAPSVVTPLSNMETSQHENRDASTANAEVR